MIGLLGRLTYGVARLAVRMSRLSPAGRAEANASLASIARINDEYARNRRR